MREGRYHGGDTIGGKWGCAVSVIVGLPLIGIAYLIAALGDCVPGADCIDGWKLILAAVAITALVGFAARCAINAIYRNGH